MVIFLEKSLTNSTDTEIADAAIRTIRVTTWLSQAEAEIIDRKRGHYNRAAYLRAAGLGREIALAPPPVNQAQWADLGRLRSDVNQIARHLSLAAHLDGADTGARAALEKVGEIDAMAGQLRAWLIGASVTSEKGS